MPASRSEILALFPPLQRLSKDTLSQVLAESHTHSYPPETRLFHEGEACQRFLLVLKGSLRVQKLTDSGREIVLYHVQPGQSCKITNSCLIGGQRYPAEAYTEGQTELLSIPKASFRRALEDNSALREEIYTSIDGAMSELVRLVEDVAFGHLDQRLARFLLTRTVKQPRLTITHQTLATELGTAREVISRLLKAFERNGWLRLHRGSIEILDREALAQI